MEPAEHIVVSVSNSNASFGVAEAGPVASMQFRFADDGFGDDDSCRDGSTGGSCRFGFGDRWCT